MFLQGFVLNNLFIYLFSGKDVIKRWTNLRDAFAKSNKKIKESKTSGSGRKIPKKYVFNDQLQFLKKLYEERVTVDSFDDGAGEEEDGFMSAFSAIAH